MAVIKENLIQRIEAKSGEIVDPENSSIPVFEIGNSGAKFIMPGGVFSYPPLPNLFKVYVKNKTLYFSSVIRDARREPVAVIDNNVWTRFKDNFEYNNNDTSFEIVTAGERSVFFHIELTGGGAYGVYFLAHASIG